MSSFKCGKCNAEILDTPRGYITECIHYPLEFDMTDYIRELRDGDAARFDELLTQFEELKCHKK